MFGNGVISKLSGPKISPNTAKILGTLTSTFQHGSVPVKNIHPSLRAGNVYNPMGKAVMRPFPKTFSVTGFGSGFGHHGSHMRSDGGIGATGDLVLSMKTHGRF